MIARSDVLGAVGLALAGVVVISPSVAGAVAVAVALGVGGWVAHLEQEADRRRQVSEETGARVEAMTGEVTALLARVDDLGNRLVRVENRTRRPGE